MQCGGVDNKEKIHMAVICILGGAGGGWVMCGAGWRGGTLQGLVGLKSETRLSFVRRLTKQTECMKEWPEEFVL